VTFTPNPNFERDLKKMVDKNLGPALRPKVQSVKCPDHRDHDPPDVVRGEDGGWQIVACCKKGAELAAKAAGVGEICWRTP
jgi:hypothetical protein